MQLLFYYIFIWYLPLRFFSCREELNCDKNHQSRCPAQICWVSFKTWASSAPSVFLDFCPSLSLSLSLCIYFLFSLFYHAVNLVYFLQMEAAWVLTNIAASDYTLLVAECGAVPRLVELLESPNANIRHQVKQLYWSLFVCVQRFGVWCLMWAPACSTGYLVCWKYCCRLA